MSIVVYATRKPDPLEDDGPSISAEEWSTAVSADPDLELSPVPTEPGFPKRGNFAVWRTYPGGYPAWFVLLDGSVEVDSPDEHILRKLCALAERLSARVISETGELFDSQGKSLGFE